MPEVHADSPPPPPPAPAFVVIVHPQSTYTSLDRIFISDAFLKKTTRWSNGEVIKAVDLAGEPTTREKFSREVHKRSVAAVKSYWQQIIFSGRDVPPPELPSDEDVIKYVQSHPNAIGYVSGSAHLTDAAKVVTIRQ